MEQHTLGTYTWVHVEHPESEELGALADELGIPSLAVEVAQRAHHRPHLEIYSGHLLLVLRSAEHRDGAGTVVVEQLVIVAGPEVVLTVGTGCRDELADVRRTLETEPERLVSDPVALVHAITSRLVEHHVAVLEQFEDEVEKLEAQVFSGTRGSHAQGIYRLKSEVQAFRLAAGPLPEELDALSTAEGLPAGFHPLRERFGDVRMSAMRSSEHVIHLDGLLNSILDAHLAQIAIQQNDDMRRISAWVAIVAAPTAMASIYGMNFRHMPELEWRYGYVLALIVMAAVCLLLYRLFKRSGWL